MIDFEYYNPARIIFGADPYDKVEKFLRSKGVKTLLMVYSGDFIKELGIYQKVEEICRHLDITFIANGSVVPNPKVELVREFSLSEGEAHRIRQKRFLLVFLMKRMYGISLKETRRSKRRYRSV